MPSVSEPCGLAQMIACRYGTLPIVRKTGGLADSIKDVSQAKGIMYLITLMHGKCMKQLNVH